MECNQTLIQAMARLAGQVTAETLQKQNEIIRTQAVRISRLEKLLERTKNVCVVCVEGRAEIEADFVTV